MGIFSQLSPASAHNQELPMTPVVPPSVPGALTGAEPDLGASTGCTVLLVDDNSDAAITLTMWLKMKGHQVHIASTGLQALSLAHQWAPEVAILDIGLPDIDGYEVARRLRAELPADEMPLLIALTGWGQAQDRLHALDAGFDHHMTKPAPLPELEALLLTRFRG